MKFATSESSVLLAHNLLKVGHDLTVFDLAPAATAPLEAQGATRAADLPALARAVRLTC